MKDNEDPYKVIQSEFQGFLSLTLVSSILQISTLAVPHTEYQRLTKSLFFYARLRQVFDK